MLKLCECILTLDVEKNKNSKAFKKLHNTNLMEVVVCIKKIPIFYLTQVNGSKQLLTICYVNKVITCQ